MNIKYCRYLILLILALALTGGLGRIPGVSATDCSEDGVVASTDTDTSCGYLDEELFVWDNTFDPDPDVNYPGIILKTIGSGDEDLKIGFNPALITEPVWGGGSSFVWEFAGSASYHPTLTFSESTITLNGRFGHTAFGVNATDQPENTVMYVKEDFTVPDQNNHAAYMELKQNAAFDLDGGDPQNPVSVFPKAMECVLNYDAQGDTIEDNNYQTIRPGAIDGQIRIVNEGRLNYANGVSGKVSISPNTTGFINPGSGVAVGVRGGVETNKIAPSGSGFGLASCLGTFTRIEQGTCNYWFGCGIESPAVLHGTIGGTEYTGEITTTLAGIGLEPLLRWISPGGLDENCQVYGIRQQGNEHNLFNGYMDVQTNIDKPEDVTSRANYEAGTSVSYSGVGTTTISNLYGYLLNSPSFNVTGSGDLIITNSYGLYLKQMKVSGYNADVTNGWGIYQEGNDDNYFNGKLHTTETLTASGTPRGRVCLTTNQTGTSDGDPVVIAFTGDVITDNVVFENYHLAVPMDGTYQVSATIRFISVEDDVDYMIGIYVGNSTDPVIASYAHPCSENTASFSMTVSDLIYLNHDNHITLQITLPDDTDYFISEEQYDTSMSICLSL